MSEERQVEPEITDEELEALEEEVSALLDAKIARLEREVEAAKTSTKEGRLELEIRQLEEEARADQERLDARREELERRLEEERTREERERQEEASREHQEIAEKCYILETEIEEYMNKALEGLSQLRVLEDKRNEAAQAAGLGTDYDLGFETVPNWLRSRMRSRIPEVAELHEIYRKPLFELHRWSRKPEEPANG